jgi:DNA-binding MarR family transcriptional regulator
MEHHRREDIWHDIADALTRGTSLLVRYLARGTNLTFRIVLATLAQDGPTRLTALAVATGVSQPAMTQCVGRMELEGLVIRLTDCADARTILIDLTDDGRALRADLSETIHARLAELLDTLSPKDEAALGMAIHVASPLIEQLTRDAAQQTCLLPAPEPERSPRSV